MKQKILEVLAAQADGFIIPNQSDFANDDMHELFYAIDSLIEAGILRRRNCEGLAYEMVPSLEAQVKAAELYKGRSVNDGPALDREIER